MKKLAIVLTLLAGLIPALLLAQDSTETPTALPPLAGDYSLEQSMGSQSMSGTLTIEGTGPVYTLTGKSANGSGGGAVEALAQGDVVAAAGASGSNEACEPATLLRQSDGTLFGQWVDHGVSDSSLGLEYYIPKAATTDFAGEYTLVGSYANGAQYKGDVTITKNENGIYSLKYAYTADEQAPDSIPGSESGTGIANGSVLGYYFSQDASAACTVLVIKFAPDGSFSGQFATSTGEVGEASGAKQ